MTDVELKDKFRFRDYFNKDYMIIRDAFSKVNQILARYGKDPINLTEMNKLIKYYDNLFKGFYRELATSRNLTNLIGIAMKDYESYLYNDLLGIMDILEDEDKKFSSNYSEFIKYIRVLITIQRIRSIILSKNLPDPKDFNDIRHLVNRYIIISDGFIDNHKNRDITLVEELSYIDVNIYGSIF